MDSSPVYCTGADILCTCILKLIIETTFLYKDDAFWMSVGKSELNEALNVQINNRVAKNVILFVGDGMGPNTVTATRIYKHGESGRLTFEKFPHMGLLKVSIPNPFILL